MAAVGQKRKQAAATGTPPAEEFPPAAKPARRRKAPAVPEATLSQSPHAASECALLADELKLVLRRFHKDVGSPLAATGLMLELVQAEPALSEESRTRLSQAVDDLDRVISTVRISINQLRGVEDILRERSR